jgi:hypothetical protein
VVLGFPHVVFFCAMRGAGSKSGINPEETRLSEHGQSQIAHCEFTVAARKAVPLLLGRANKKFW